MVIKSIISSILFVFFAGLVNAATFSVGGKELVIPSPKGFSIVTQKMDAVYRLSLQMADSANDQLAYYIAESAIPIAISGEMPHLDRYYILKINKKLKNMVVGSKDFAELKSITKRQNHKIIKSVETQMPGLMEKTAKGISKEFDVDFALKLSQMLPLSPHHETNNTFSYSMYINYGTVVEGIKDDYIISATATFVNVAGKVLFLYCYGPKEDLEWTRKSSKTWSEMIMTSNAEPPSHSSGGRGIHWDKVLENALVWAIAGGLIAMIFGIFSKSKKKG